MGKPDLEPTETHLRHSRQLKGFESYPTLFGNGKGSCLADGELKKFRARCKHQGERRGVGERHKLLMSLQGYSRIKALLADSPHAALLLTFLLRKAGKGLGTSCPSIILSSTTARTLSFLLPVRFRCSCHKTTLTLARKIKEKKIFSLLLLSVFQITELRPKFQQNIRFLLLLYIYLRKKKRHLPMTIDVAGEKRRGGSHVYVKIWD